MAGGECSRGDSHLAGHACVNLTDPNVVCLSVVRGLLTMSPVRIICFDPTYGRGLWASHTALTIPDEIVPSFVDGVYPRVMMKNPVALCCTAQCCSTKLLNFVVAVMINVVNLSFHVARCCILRSRLFAKTRDPRPLCPLSPSFVWVRCSPSFHLRSRLPVVLQAVAAMAMAAAAAAAAVATVSPTGGSTSRPGQALR